MARRPNVAVEPWALSILRHTSTRTVEARHTIMIVSGNLAGDQKDGRLQLSRGVTHVAAR